MALFAIGRLLDEDTPARAKLTDAVIFLSALTGMLLSFSRACWLAFGAALVVYFFSQFLPAEGRQPGRPRLQGAATVLVAGIGLSVILINTPAVKDMLAMRVTDSGLQGYDRVRFATQALSLEEAQNRPLGIGPGQAEVVFGYATHSMYMRILSENGVFALLAILIFVGATLARTWQNIRHTPDPVFGEINRVVLASIAGHLLNSAVIDTVHWRHIWFIYALPWLNVTPLHYWRPLRARTTIRRRVMAESAVSS
jgi:O-antigen ligase